MISNHAMTTLTAMAATKGEAMASMPRAISKTPQTTDNVETCRTTADGLFEDIEIPSADEASLVLNIE
jgi:hypothetical protein